MTPRQRLSPQASLVDFSSSSLSTASSSGTSTPAEGRPLLENKDQQLQTSSSSSQSLKDAPVVEARFVLASDVARMHHDYFNLIALVIVIASAAADWNFKLLLQGMGPASYDGRYWWLTYTVMNLYFLADLIWVSQVPHCVKSPRTIVQHHLVVIAYIFCPVVWAEYRWFVGPLLSVEINTWFMILRRVLFKHKINPILSDAVAFSFYVSWIVIRCGIYPAVLFHLFHLADVAIQESGKLWHWPMMFIPVHFALCCLNAKWSFDLFYPIVKSWFVEDSRKPTVSNGL